MLKQSDVEGRLRLFRFGLLVIVIITFAVSLSAQVVALNGVEGRNIVSFLPFTLGATVAVGVLLVIVYFIYARLIKGSAQ